MQKLRLDYLQGLPIETCSVYMILCNRWFCVERGSADNPSVILVHGFPSQVSEFATRQGTVSYDDIILVQCLRKDKKSNACIML